jgi:hypothetical protein
MGDRKPAIEMNPHYLFVSIMLASAGLMTAAFAAEGSVDELYEMATVLGIAGACVGAVLLLTRKYWKDARRLG